MNNEVQECICNVFLWTFWVFLTTLWQGDKGPISHKISNNFKLKILITQFDIFKQESLALASMVRDDPPTSSMMSSTAAASSMAAAMHGKVGSEFEI